MKGYVFINCNLVLPLNNLQTMPSVEWIVSDWKQGNAAPLLMVVKNRTVKAVCFNMLDVAILRKLFEDNAEPDLSVIGVESMAHSYYYRQAEYATKIIKIISPVQVIDTHL